MAYATPSDVFSSRTALHSCASSQQHRRCAARAVSAAGAEQALDGVFFHNVVEGEEIVVEHRDAGAGEAKVLVRDIEPGYERR